MIPFQLVPGEDESMSSWLVRLSRQHYNKVQDFCAYFHIDRVLKSPLDIEVNRALIQDKLKLQIDVPSTISEKLPCFKWDRGRSKWLIEPNRKGQALLSSFTKICPGCLSSKGFYQLKWKLNLFNGCVDCGTYLYDKCPGCKRSFSPLRADVMFPIQSDLSPLYYCSYCRIDFRRIPGVEMTVKDFEQLILINRAYTENPVNLRYLTFLQFGVIEGISIRKL